MNWKCGITKLRSLNGEIATEVVGMVQNERQYQPRVGGRKLYSMLKPRLRELHVGRDRLFKILRANHMYLALVTDAYSKKILGYDLSSSLGADGTVRALKMANSNRAYPHLPLIHHSDRGIQYCSDIYQDLLCRYGITPSMTESYDPYANAVAERVNGILKQEFILEDYNYPIEIMRNIVADAIEIYNRRRPHSSCDFLTP